ncbi:Uncharacterized protein OBRU01_02684 [Operophtera brumata]|uniref:Uncharacterized protein n=1 Tax=Operophtera brumata TaxID=104452 RepID=A0A0L7LSX0_OPEBR|nr:Uncharacterized protein OBRU01_02684 [Operophtera brumata]
MRTAQRDILSVCLAQLSDVSHLGSGELRQLAKELGRHMRQKPQVVQKKEQARKDDIRKTNLLMANIFKKRFVCLIVY